MALDPYLLATARASARTLQDAEQSLEPLRRDYCGCLRALNAAGGSLREIATEFGLSHQRVHQLVQGDRAITKRQMREKQTPARPRTLAGCCLCGDDAGHRSAAVPLCMPCHQAALSLLAGEGEAEADGRGIRLLRRHQRPRCLGCERLPEAGETFIGGPLGALCPQCLGG